MVKFGKLYCSVQLVDLILLIHKYKRINNRIEDNMEYWYPVDWRDFVPVLIETKQKILRKDAVIFIPAPLVNYDNNKITFESSDVNELLNDEEVDENISSSPLFSNKFDEILNLCHVHWALSHIRYQVAAALEISDETVAELQ